ncbi:hypothetical protein CMI45_02815 [Candidatus Pacearchaeota archaeon]|nr:hypothetical protein [Candidatus Pacearchaeota archaeon]|tara:strand:- start:6267 stop:6653 length:387 start_codon:yes stop_codon:yes gene_type:complete
MVLKNNLQQTSETLYERETIVEHEVEEMIYEILEKSDWSVSGKLIDEIKKYANKNSFVFDSYSIHDNEDVTVKVCCIKCLKAHALAKAKELELNSDLIRVLEEVFNCDTGHNGYYLNREKAIKVEDLK